MIPGPQTTISRYALAFASVCLAAAIRTVFEPWLTDRSPLLPFSIAILISGLFAGTGPGVFATVLSMIFGIGFFALTVGGPFTELLPHILLFLVLSASILYVAHANCQSHEKGVIARRALEQREQELRTVIDALPVGIWLTDQNGTVITTNRAVRTIWGGARYVGVEDYGQYKMWSSETGKLIEVPDYPGVRALSGETILNEVIEIEPFTGGRKDILISAMPLRIGDGPILGAVIVNEDITERRRALEELRNAKEQAEAANLAKDRFLAVLSHELRTPLTPVLMLAESLESHPGLPSTLRIDAAMMRRHVALEARLIDDLLDLTRIEKGKLHLERHLVDIHDILVSAVEMVRSEANAKEVKIGMEMRGYRRYINADRSRIKQVVLNLLGNALKFTQSGGSITVRAECRGDFVWVGISDTGIGIASESLTSIFDAFEQADATHRRFGGLGLGLAIAKSLLELHGGSIHANSPGVGRGAVFEFMLPAFEGPPQTASAPQPVHDESGTRLRILLVEDHEPTAFVLARLLRRRGHEVRMAASVREALAFDDQPIDLLVSDIGLPDGSGIDVIRHYRAAHSDFQAIALSGFGMDSDVENSLQAGFDRHLTKPVDFQTLQRAIAGLCDPMAQRG